MASVTAPGLVTSQGAANAWPPALRIESAVSSAPATLTSPQATLPPSWPKRTAVARPMPDAAPETKIERPSNRFMRQSETCFTRPRKRALPVSPSSPSLPTAPSGLKPHRAKRHVPLAARHQDRARDAGRALRRARDPPLADARLRVPRWPVRHRRGAARGGAPAPLLLARQLARLRRGAQVHRQEGARRPGVDVH